MSRMLTAAGAAALLAAFVVQAFAAAKRDSVTIDEFVHLPVGLYALKTGDLTQDPINPPHTRMLAALAVRPAEPVFDVEPGTPHWGLGYRFMEQNVARYHELFVRGRAAIIALSVVLGVAVVAWAWALAGAPAALFAAALFAFSPSMLAHGHLVTLDQAGALGVLATAAAVWWMLDRPTLARALVVGVVLGAASLLKLSAFVLLAMVALAVAWRAWSERGLSAGRWLGVVAAVAFAALVVINAGYGWLGTFAPLSSVELAAGGVLARLRDAAPWLRLPLPTPFLRGIDMVLQVGRAREPSYFLAGELSSDGWWYYHLAAFALKSPAPVVALSVAAFGAWLARCQTLKREYCLWIPVIVIFAANAMFNSLQIGVRHVLAVYPLLFVAIAARATLFATATRARTRGIVVCVLAAALAWHVTGTLRVAPRYLQFFNEIAGGPENGHHWLIDSNIDWGQDLVRLREYIEGEGLDFVNLAYFGRVHPAVYGIRFAPLERGRSRGPTAISASFLMGRPYFWYLGGRMRWVPANTYTWLQEHEPVARVGAMFIYDLR